MKYFILAGKPAVMTSFFKKKKLMLTVWKTKALMRKRRLIIYSTDGLSTIKTGFKYNNFSYIIVTFFNVKNENNNNNNN